MIVEIKGVNFINKGAELMLRAILKEFQERGVNVEFCLNAKDISLAPTELSNLNFYPWRYSQKIPFLGKLLNFLFEKAGINYFKGRKVVTRNQIDVVLDASGFVYSEQWGSESAELMASYYQEAKKRGQKVILLPQAFGPFEQEKMIKAMKQILHEADLVFARDKISFSLLKELAPKTKNLNLSKDFTIKLKGESVDKDTHGKICIIPNYRMIDMRNDNEYLDFLDNAVSSLNELNYEFYFLIHESDKDRILVGELEKRNGVKYEVIAEENPLKIKTLIGNSKFVIASRFHGIVSALSQNIPTIATGWSHKYEMLYNEYDIRNLYLDNLTEQEKIIELIQLFNDEAKINLIEQKLKAKNQVILADVNQMWNKVFSIISEN